MVQVASPKWKRTVAEPIKLQSRKLDAINRKDDNLGKQVSNHRR